MYKIVAVDLDETLFNEEYKVCERNKKAIEKTKSMGIKIVPCTGRTPGILGTLFEDLNINEFNEYSILGNGAIIIENKSGRIINKQPISFEKAKELFVFGMEHNLCVQFYTTDCAYFYFTDEEEKQFVLNAKAKVHFREDKNIEELKDICIVKMIFERKDMKYLQSLEKALLPITENAISISFSSNRYMEINRLGIHKGLGLQNLAEYLNVDMKDTIGIGDNLNDIGLIKEAGLGAAVNNAVDEIKNIADYICEADNNEGAVGEVIEKFILNQ